MHQRASHTLYCLLYVTIPVTYYPTLALERESHTYGLYFLLRNASLLTHEGKSSLLNHKEEASLLNHEGETSLLTRKGKASLLTTSEASLEAVHCICDTAIFIIIDQCTIPLHSRQFMNGMQSNQSLNVARYLQRCARV